MKKDTVLWTKNFILLSLVNVLLFFAWQMMMPTLPLYIDSLGGSSVVIGFVGSVTTVAAILIRPVSGFALDSFGRRRILITGLAIFTAVFVSYSFLPFIWAVFMLRFLHGTGWGISTTSCSTAVSDMIPKKRFAEGMGIFTLSQSISLAFAPASGLAIMAAAGFRNTTLLSAVMGGMALVLALFVKYRPAERIKRPRGAIYEKASIRPTAVMIFVAVPFGSALFFISLYGIELGIDNIGLFFTVCASALFISRIFMGRLADRFGFNATVFPGFALFIASMILLSLSKSLTGILISAAMQGVAYGALQTSMQTMAILSAPEKRTGAANATFYSGLDIGYGFGSLIAGALIAAVGYSRMYFLMTLPLIIGAALYFFTSRKPALKDEALLVPPEEGN